MSWCSSRAVLFCAGVQGSCRRLIRTRSGLDVPDDAFSSDKDRFTSHLKLESTRHGEQSDVPEATEYSDQKTIDDLLAKGLPPELKKQRSTSRYGDDDFELEQSVIITRPERWQLQDNNLAENVSTEFENRIENNPYVRLLVTPIRQCNVWHATLPIGFLQRFSVFDIPKKAGAIDPEFEQALQYETLNNGSTKSASSGQSHIDFLILPRDVSTGVMPAGPSSYILHNRSYIEYAERVKRWADVGRPLTKAFDFVKLGWRSNMHILILRRRRLAILDQLKWMKKKFIKMQKHNFIETRHMGVFADYDEANKKGRVLMEMCWDPAGDLTDTNSSYFINKEHRFPGLKFNMARLCGPELAMEIREASLTILPTSYDIEHPPTSIYIIDDVETIWLMAELWKIRLYIGQT
ncbi:hypothetical protein V1512DRAFT_258431 [Lipomyces arxii]|uniref:uncharacterized protein n=1 Tax=Lipomyces arxii TaxID=56418 RepID=UPI0034CE255B